MVGITLSSEQIRSAPREVRQWLEQEVLASFGWELPAAQPTAPQLAACTPDDVFKVLSLVRETIPVVNVLFELGHAGMSIGEQALEAFRLADIQRHVRLATTEQVAACLQVINNALCRVRNDDSLVFYALDDRGYCFISEQTRRSIAQVWQQIVAERQPEPLVQRQPAPATVATASSRPVWSAPARPADGTPVAGRLQG